MNAETYLEHWRKIEGWTHYHWPKHEKRFRNISAACVGRSCIDIGCGFGHSTKKLAGLYRADWTGLEFSAGAVNAASHNFPKLKFIYSAGYDFERACRQKYDSVVCSEVIEHVEDDGAFIDALMKITERKLILTTPSRYVDDPGHLRLYDEAMFRHLLEGLGFTLKSVGGFYFVSILA